MRNAIVYVGQSRCNIKRNQAGRSVSIKLEIYLIQNSHPNGCEKCGVTTEEVKYLNFGFSCGEKNNDKAYDPPWAN